MDRWINDGCNVSGSKSWMDGWIDSWMDCQSIHVIIYIFVVTDIDCRDASGSRYYIDR